MGRGWYLIGMDKTTRLALLAILLAVPAGAQMRTRVETPVVPVIGGPALSAAAIGGLQAPGLKATALPTLTMPSAVSASPVLPAAAPALPTVMASGRFSTPATPAASPLSAPSGAAVAALPEAPKAEKPTMGSLEAAAKPFGSAEGRTSPKAAASLATTFDASKLPSANEPADVIPGVRLWPRVMGVGLANPVNGVKEDKKAETPAPKKADEEKPLTGWRAVGTGLLLALCLAGSLFAWYQLYASMGQIMYQGEQQLYQQYYGPVPTIDEIFGGR